METNEKREGEMQRERLIWSSDEHMEKQQERSQIVTVGVRRTLPEMEFASLRVSLPRFSGRFSLIPDSAPLSLCNMSFEN